MFAHIVKEAFAREGVAVSYQFFPWKRALLMAEHAEVSASPGWIQTEERSKLFLFSDPVLISRTTLFYRRDRPLVFNTMADLKGKTIGAAVGYTYGEAFDQAAQGGEFTVDRTSSDEANLRKLLLGRLDAVAVNRAVGFDILTRFTDAEQKQLAATDRNVNEQASRMAVSRALPNAEQLLKTFNTGLAKLQRDGTVKRLLADVETGVYSKP